jgi:ABC-type Na+ efflux pump permease subunit
MSLKRLFAVGRQELAHNVRRPLFWVWAAVLVLFAWAFSYGAVRIQSGDSSVGGTKAFITSEFAVAQFLTVLTAIVYGFFVSVAAGMAIIQDDEWRVGELLHATGLRPGEYVWGKFLAVLASALGILAIHVVAMVVCNHVLRPVKALEYLGPFDPWNYLRPALLFALPSIVFAAGLAFALGERTRRPILVYFLPVATLLLGAFFLWDWAPSWLDPRIDKLLMLVDPAAFRWLQQTHLKVDRGAQFYNQERIPLDAVVAINRLLVVALGLGAVAYSHLRFAKGLRGAVRVARPRTDLATEPAAPPAAGWPTPYAPSPIPPYQGREPEPFPVSPTPDLDKGGLGGVPTIPSASVHHARRPGLLSAAWTIARMELIELRSSPGLYLFIPLLLLEATGPNLIAIGAFDTPLLLTSGTFAQRAMNPLATMICLLLMFYTVESFLRERTTRLVEISEATPVRTGSILIGKALANSFIALLILLGEFLVGAGMLLYQGKVPIQAWPFAVLWGLLLVPTVVLWTTFVMVLVALTRNRYVTYAIALSVLIFTGYRQVTSQINWVGNWPLWSAVRWSDISLLELDRLALVLSRLMALGLALLFIALTVRFYPRIASDPIRVMFRLRPVPLLLSSLRLLPFAVLPCLAGAMLWTQVDYGFEGEATKKLEKDYWRKNLATYRDYPLPGITAVDLAVELDPARGWFRSSGTAELVNHQARALTQVQFTGGPHWDPSSLSWSLNGKPFKPVDRSHLYVFMLPEPLEPGKSLRVGFRCEGTVPKGISKRGGGTSEFILPSGVVLTAFSPSFLPLLGFSEQIGVDDDNKYDSKEYPDDFYKGQTDSFLGSRAPFRTRIAITGPAEFTYNSVGVKTSDTVTRNRRTTVWTSDQPVNFFNIVAGRWAVARGEGTAVYYHPAHTYNVRSMVQTLDACRRYYGEWFRPFPWRELKLSEFPAMADYAQGFPTDITFSESIGFLTGKDAGADAPFLVTAHEAAHQWWGNMVAPGKGPGGNLLSEGTSHFSTLLLFEQVKGVHARIDFAKRIEDSYAKDRRADSERPLVKIDGSRDGDTAVTYDKAGFVFWMLLNHMGRDRMLAGVRDYFQRYQASEDHPVLQDFLTVLRPHADDPKTFDSFTRQWFHEVVLPEYRVDDSGRTRAGQNWNATARVTNIGTGTMPVEVAAIKGERFDKAGKPNSDYREARQTLVLGAGASGTVKLSCGFEPEKIVVDPDAKVLQLGRKTAVKAL